MSNVDAAVGLLRQALSLLEGCDAPAPQAAVSPPAPAGRSRRPAPSPSSKMPFGKYKDWTLTQIQMHDPQYLGWIADKFGMKDDGTEDPKYAAENAQFRQVARTLMHQEALGTSAPQPAPAPVAPPAPEAVPVPGDEEIPF